MDITKKQRAEMRALLSPLLAPDEDGGVTWIYARALALLDALDEMEQQRDEVLAARINAIDLRPGDALLLRMRGVNLAASSGYAERIEAVRKTWQEIIERAGLAGVTVILADVESEMTALRMDKATPQ